VSGRGRTPFSDVWRLTRIRAAWNVVRTHGLASRSEETRKGVRRFEANLERNLRRISDQLRGNRFEFEKSTGVAVEKKSGGRRPIVVAPVANRVVQRALLDVLAEQPGIAAYLATETSFGAVRGSGVPEAIARAWAAMRDGYRYYLRSDIPSFFANIDRSLVLKRIAEIVPDPPFRDLLAEATATDLENREELEAAGFAHLFPMESVGVPQGCSLSSLIGNVLLRDFDVSMNGAGVVCLRYVDDVLILACARRQLRGAVRSARDRLGKLGLGLYDPSQSPGKAEEGDSLADGFEFLGCRVSLAMIRPTPKKQRELLSRVREVLRESYAAMADASSVREDKAAVVETLAFIDRLLLGWGNQYSFCNDPNGLAALDRDITKLVGQYLGRFAARRDALPPQSAEDDGRRLLGVHLLRDSKRDPIVRSPSKTRLGDDR
jgi:retron-type reverse transcriptase